MAACDDTKYVENVFMIENRTSQDVVCYVALRRGDRTYDVELLPGERKPFTRRKGMRGIYMIDELFACCNVTINKDSSVFLRNTFQDSNYWQDYQESDEFKNNGGDLWVDTCTFILTPEILKMPDL